jgi:hypothetical protein
LRALILGFATAAIVVSAAEARVSNYNTSAQQARTAMNQSYTPEALRALALRSEAMNQQYQSQAIRPDDRSGSRGVESTVATPWMGQINRYVFDDQEALLATSTPDLSEIQRHVRADAALSQGSTSRPDDRAGFRGPGIVETPQLVTVSGGGFDWTDASIGFGVTAGMVLLLISGLVISRRRSGLAA